MYFSYTTRNKQKLSKIEQMQKLNKARKTFFGEMYDRILLGYKLSQDEFNHICTQQNVSTEDVVKVLKLKVISEISF